LKKEEPLKLWQPEQNLILKQVLLSDATVSSQKYSASSPDDGKAKTTFETGFY
jgi:hypothetical protein